MNFKDYIPIILGVLKDFRVIATVVSMLLIVSFAKYIKNYTKKPKVKRKKGKSAAPKKVEQKPAEEEEGFGGNENE